MYPEQSARPRRDLTERRRDGKMYALTLLVPAAIIRWNLYLHYGDKVIPEQK